MTEADRALEAVLQRAGGTPLEFGSALAFGPIPMTVSADEAALADQVVAHAADSADVAAATWRPLRILLCTGRTVPRDDLPAPLRPGPSPGPVTLVRTGSHVALVSDGMTWVLDLAGGTALRWSETVADVPVWEAHRPLRFALRWWAAVHDAALLHAAAVAVDGRGALLVGAGGAGKSTTAYSCLGSGLDVLGDDYCLVRVPADGDDVTVHATYRLGNLDDNALGLLPRLRERVIERGPQGKWVLPLDDLDVARASATVEAVCAVVQAPGEETRAVPSSAALTTQRLGPSTLSQIPGFAQETWRVVRGVATRRPSFELRVGSLPDASTALAGLLAAAPA
jgi:hypothetical protein